MQMKSRILLLSCLLAVPWLSVHAEGEAVNGFPNWSERVLLEWINRARVDPQVDLASCPTGNCAEKACYTPQPPRVWNAHIAHSARFHSDAMLHNNFFDHYSECTLLSTVATGYLASPQSCNGSASCACSGGALGGSGSGTDPFVRMGMFGASSTGGEIIAWDGAGPDDSFYLWLFESSSSTQCTFSSANGHRFLILRSDYGASSAGPGVSGALSTVDFDNEPTSNPKIPSGSHFPQQAASVDAWVNWHDAAAPSAHTINVDGVCSNMTLARGSATNGAWHAQVNGVGSGCHRYVFAFKDSAGNAVTYPTTGSLAIGNGGAQCADWVASAPASCADIIYAGNFGG
jgi:hypothetical protein